MYIYIYMYIHRYTVYILYMYIYIYISVPGSRIQRFDSVSVRLRVPAPELNGSAGSVRFG